jgi:purine-binding chemotaxis protein CheW
MMQMLQNKLHFLRFMLNDTYFCVEVQHVSKVMPLMFLTAAPGSPHYMVGLMNLEGKTLPVIDLSLRLNIKRNKKYTLNTPVLLCIYNQKKSGIVVDKIIDIVDIDESCLQMKKEFLSADSPFSGTITIGTDLVLLIDIGKILQPRDKRGVTEVLC